MESQEDMLGYKGRELTSASYLHPTNFSQRNCTIFLRIA